MSKQGYHSSPKTEGRSQAPSSAPVPSTEAQCLALLEELRASHGGLQGNQATILQQMGTLQQFVATCTQQTAIAAARMEAELGRFRTGGPQQAMAAVFHRLFRELAVFAGQMDELSHGAKEAKLDPSWRDAIEALRERFEGLLSQWGCAPVDVNPGTEFDPERHESMEALPGEVPPDAQEHTVVAQRVRGWQLHGHLIKHPKVVVA